MRVIFLLFMQLTALSAVVAQQEKKMSWWQRASYDSSYITSYYNQHLHVTLISHIQNFYLSMDDVNGKTSTTYRPNNVWRFGASLDYNIFSAEYTQSVDAIDKPSSLNGATEVFSLRLGITGRRILTNLYLQTFRGMYISNADELIQQGIAVPNHRRRDMMSQSAYGVANYFFNHYRYSTMASLWQIDRQKHSAGSWVAGVTASAMRIHSDSTFLLTTAVLAPGDRIKDNQSYLAGINLGYACNIILFRNWFVNLMMIPGLNLQYGYNLSESGERQYYGVKGGYHADARMIAGYNGEVWYFGVHSSNYLLSNSLKDNVDVHTGNSYFRVFVGRRFFVPIFGKRHS